MFLYCKGDHVIATHEDDAGVEPGAYGSGVFIVPAPADTALSREGPEPEGDGFDGRPRLVPDGMLGEAKALAERLMLERANALTDSLVSKYPTAVQKTFDRREREARAVVEGETKPSDARYLMKLTGGVYQAVTPLAERILEKAEAIEDATIMAEKIVAQGRAAIYAADSYPALSATLAALEGEAAKAAAAIYARLGLS